jgi:hypothetical protein
MPTSVKPNTDVAGVTDIKVQTKKQVQTKLVNLVKDYVESSEKKLWLVADEIHYIINVLKYSSKDAREMLREAFCTAYKIKWADRNENKSYNSFAAVLARVSKVAEMPPKWYEERKASGKTVTAVWAVLTGDGGKLDKKLKAIENGQEDITKASLEKEGEEGVANSKELAATIKGKKPVDTGTALRERDKQGWSAPENKLGYDTDNQWMNTCREILRNEPQVFVKMIEKCVNAHLLPDDVLEAIKEFVS